LDDGFHGSADSFELVQIDLNWDFGPLTPPSKEGPLRGRKSSLSPVDLEPVLQRECYHHHACSRE
jgi:hypothetical protein